MKPNVLNRKNIALDVPKSNNIVFFINFLMFFIYYFMCMSVLPVCRLVHPCHAMHGGSQKRASDSPGTGVKDSS